jgi:hypothetical protein
VCVLSCNFVSSTNDLHKFLAEIDDFFMIRNL